MYIINIIIINNVLLMCNIINDVNINVICNNDYY